MKKRGLALILSAAMIFSAATSFGGKIAKAQNISKSQQIISNFQRLSGGGLKLQLRQNNGLQTYISGRLSGKVTPSVSAAMKFISDNEAVLGLTGSGNFKAVSAFRDGYGNSYVKLNQMINGLPVYGRELTVTFNKDNVISSVLGDIENKATTVTKLGSRTLTMDQAVTIAAKKFNYISLRQVPTAENLIYIDGGKAYEAYRVNIQYNKPVIGNYDVYVEMHSGRILKTVDNVRYDGPVTGSGVDVQGITRPLNLYQSGTTYQLKDTTKAMTGQILTYTARYAETEPGTLMTSSSTTVSDKAAVSAHYFAGVVYDFYKNLFNRNSIDANGMTILSTVHYGSSYNNAFWDGSQMVYGDGDGSEFTYFSGDLDVVGHEMTHGVTDRTAAMEYQDQPGALNESVSDIFGVLIETYDKYNVKNGGTWSFNSADWVVGDDIYTPATPGDALRSLANPTLYDQPDNMDDYVYTSSDYGGVHTNCGITNKAAYLIAQTIGCAKTAQIYYKALTTYFDTTTDFEASETGLIQAATDLYGAGSAEVTAIQNGYAAVGIGSGGGGTTDTYEPNDTTATAYAITSGTTYNSYISTSTDVDYYKAVTTSTGTIAISLTNLPGDYDLYLYNSSGTQLAKSINSGTSSESISYSAAAGTYYIKVLGYNGAKSTTQAYALKATFNGGTPAPTDNYEPNDTIATAYAINFGTNYTSYISTSTDVDYYKVTTTAAGTIAASLSTLPANYDLYLVNSSGTTLASSTNTGTASEALSYNAAAAGTYYIKVAGVSSAYSSSPYTLSATFTATSTGDTYEPNDTIATAYAINFGTAYNSYISTTTDVDYYKVTTTASGTIGVTLTNLAGDYDLYLVNSSGTTLASSTNGSTTNESLSYSAATGTYYIKVIGYSGAMSTTKAYALTATFTGGSSGSDPYEPNNTTSAAYQITSGTTYNAYIGSSTDVDYFKVVTTRACTIAITLSSLPKDYDLYLYNSSGSQLARSINGGTYSESISYSVSGAGTYYIKVIGYSGAYSTTAAYALKATFQ